MSSWMVFLQSMKKGLIYGTSFSQSLSTFYYFIITKKRRTEPFINVNFLTKNLNVSFIYVQYMLATIIFFALLLSNPNIFTKGIDARLQNSRNNDAFHFHIFYAYDAYCDSLDGNIWI